MPPEMSKFQLMLEQAKKNLPKPVEKPIKDTKLDLQKLLSLPSEITTKSGKNINELLKTKEKDVKESIKRKKNDDEWEKPKKSLSYDELMKIAKNNSMEGLKIKNDYRESRVKDNRTDIVRKDYNKDREHKDYNKDREHKDYNKDRVRKDYNKDRVPKDRELMNDKRLERERIDKYNQKDGSNLRKDNRPIYERQGNTFQLSKSIISNPKYQSGIDNSSKSIYLNKPSKQQKRISLKNPNVNDLVVLQTKKRDLASVADIQEEMLRKKGLIKEPKSTELFMNKSISKSDKNIQKSVKSNTNSDRNIQKVI